MPIDHWDERVAIASMMIKILKSSRDVYFPGKSLSATCELVQVAIIVLLCEDRGNSASVSHIARQLGASRPTVRRRLRELVRCDYVRPSGRGYVCSEGLNLVNIREHLRRQVAVIDTTDKKLDKMAI